MRVGEAPRRHVDLGDRPADHGRAQHRAGIPHFPRRFEDRDHSYREFKNNSGHLWKEDAPPPQEPIYRLSTQKLGEEM